MRTLAVIIAARQAEKWLPQCLASVAGQTLPPGWRLRILLGVDECSTTLRVASQLGYPQLSVSYFPVRVGPYVIFNSLACRAHANVFARFDADDIMLDSYLQSQLSSMENSPRPMITQTWSIFVDEQLLPVSAALCGGKRTGKDGRRYEGSAGQFMMNYSAWQRLGSFRPWLCHADAEFLTRARWAGIPAGVVQQHLYLRRVHQASLTQSGDTGYRSQLRKSYARHIEESAQRYSRGLPPEQLWPIVAGFVPGDSARQYANRGFLK
jgi:glycosyltransferase involved in cell wall biosynthesis